jgi:ATP-dependent RNA helicase DHX8/PRP22
MVHIGSIALGQRLNSPADVLTKNQAVKVKVMSVSGTRLSLSMKDVDQRTGGDLTPHLRQKTEAELLAGEERMRAPPAAASSSNATPLYAVDEPKHSSAKRLTSPERWEIKQLIASGVVDASEYPNLDEEHTLSMENGAAEIEEEVDIETREDEAPFLAGQKRGIMEMSPVKVVKAPDGSLNRAALASEVYAKERRELRQQEAQDKADSEARDFNAPWLDPMAAKGDKQFAMDLRGSLMGEKGMDEPEWKKENKSMTFGPSRSLSPCSVGSSVADLPLAACSVQQVSSPTRRFRSNGARCRSTSSATSSSPPSET